MKRSLGAILGTLAFTAAAASVLAGAADAEQQSRKVSGHIHFEIIERGESCPSPTGNCWRETYTGGIEGVGKTAAKRQSASDPPNVIFINEDEVIHTNDGDIAAKVSAAYDSTAREKPCASLHVITGGTGRYAGASGYLQITVVANKDATSAEGDYVGVVVTNR